MVFGEENYTKHRISSFLPIQILLCWCGMDAHVIFGRFPEMRQPVEGEKSIQVCLHKRSQYIQYCKTINHKRQDIPQQKPGAKLEHTYISYIFTYLLPSLLTCLYNYSIHSFFYHKETNLHNGADSLASLASPCEKERKGAGLAVESPLQETYHQEHLKRGF